MAESQDATLLQRRARRRLVGAIALVVFVVIVFPIVLDKERKPAGQDLVIHIPSQEAGKFNTRVLPAKPPEAEAPVPLGTSKADSPAAVVETPAKAVATPNMAAAKEVANPTDEVAAAKSPVAAGKSAATEGEGRSVRITAENGWMVPLGAFTDAKNVRELQAKLGSGGMKSYTEIAKSPRGQQTRVRAGPFESKEEAEKAREKLKSMGISAGAVAAQGGSGR